MRRAGRDTGYRRCPDGLFRRRSQGRHGWQGLISAATAPCVELQRQLILDPDAIPEPPVDDVSSLRPIALRFSAVMGLAALIAWVVVSLPGMKKASEIMPSEMKTPALAVNPVKLVQVRSTPAAPQVSEGVVAMNNPSPPVSPPPSPPVSPPPSPPPSPSASLPHRRPHHSRHRRQLPHRRKTPRPCISTMRKSLR